MNQLPDQIYNADGLALFWKLLSNHTLIHIKETSAPGRKSSKEPVIGKARNSRAFTNGNIPVEYHSTKNAWMTSALFVEWFHTPHS
ncbi:hypothetical protein Trydic_g20108 [Trypoxylus dichotomus]